MAERLVVLSKPPEFPLCTLRNYSIMWNLDAVCAPLPFDFLLSDDYFEENNLLSRTIEKKNAAFLNFFVCSE